MFRRFTYASILFYCPMQRIARKRISGLPITDNFKYYFANGSNRILWLAIRSPITAP